MKLPFYPRQIKGDGRGHPCDIIGTPVFANNRVYIIKRQDDVFIKRLKKSGELFEIISDNPDYESYKLEHEKIQIIGRVV